MFAPLFAQQHARRISICLTKAVNIFRKPSALPLLSKQPYLPALFLGPRVSKYVVYLSDWLVTIVDSQYCSTLNGTIVSLSTGFACFELEEIPLVKLLLITRAFQGHRN